MARLARAVVAGLPHHVTRYVPVEYIVQNRVKAGLAESAEQYPYGYTYPGKAKSPGAKGRV
jgi:hypothetical protein